MIVYDHRGIFDADETILVNPVNCVGVMGSGLALRFKQRYPAMFADYAKVCRAGELHPGRLHAVAVPDGHLVVNLPTKRHWRDQSIVDDILAGLVRLKRDYQSFYEVAMPRIGCGHGGLNWDAHVAPMVRQVLSSSFRVVVYTGHVGRQYPRYGS